MQTTIVYPSNDLAPFVDHYLFLEMDGQSNESLSFRDFPRTAMDMLFFFKGNVALDLSDGSQYTLDTCSFVSIFDSNYLVTLSKDISAVMVRFKANGIYPLTKIPMKELLNNHLELNQLLDQSANEVREKMQEKEARSGKIKILENWLLQRYEADQRHFRLDQGIALIEKSKGLVSVKAVSEHLNTNYKSLDRWFLKNVGLPPKRYIQLARFKNILSELEQQKKIDWMQLVANYGFHDQAHFIKSFKQYAGMAPSNFAALGSPPSTA